MVCLLLDAIEFTLEVQGEPQTHEWLTSQMMEVRLWRCSEHDVRAALQADLRKWSEQSRFVKMADDEWGQRKWED